MRHHFANNSPSSQSNSFSSIYVWMWELDQKEGWVPKNWCFQTVVLEKTLESPLDCKEMKPSILKEISPECSLEGLMLKLKCQYFGYLMWRTDSLEKTLMLGKTEDRRRRRRQWMRVWWHHWLDEHEFEQTPGDSEGQGRLVCCSPRGDKESGVTEWLNNNRMSVHFAAPDSGHGLF